MIAIHDVTVDFGQGYGLRYADYVFETGKSYVLLGASGCGKSTLLNMIAGVLTPSSGVIMTNGIELSALSQREKDAYRIANIGYIFQDFKLIEEMTVEDNIAILKLEKVNIDGQDPF